MEEVPERRRSPPVRVEVRIEEDEGSKEVSERWLCDRCTRLSY